MFIFGAAACSRNSGGKGVDDVQAGYEEPAAARPMAVLRTGEQPLWFQLTDEGPVHLAAIEDAVLSAAFIPWPLAPHIRFFQERDDELVMAVNRDGFLKLAPYSGNISGIALYRFNIGGEIWRQYTIGGFVFYDDKPAALLYLDDRFLDTDAPLPLPRTWTFNMESNRLLPLDIPALEQFPAEEGWDVDTLRAGPDGFWYYRVSKKRSSRSEIRMLRTTDLAQAGENISLGVFYNSAPRQTDFFHPSLPSLPEGFFYTGIGRAADSLFASWEEQNNFYIGAAGFVVIGNSN